MELHAVSFIRMLSNYSALEKKNGEIQKRKQTKQQYDLIMRALMQREPPVQGEPTKTHFRLLYATPTVNMKKPLENACNPFNKK